MDFHKKHTKRSNLFQLEFIELPIHVNTDWYYI